MPFLVVVTPNILAEKKDEFLGRWPSIKEDISKQPGVIGVAGVKAFAESAWAKEREAQFKGIHGGEPRIKKFETGPLPSEKPKPFTQFSFLDIADESKHEEAKQAWLDLVAALGQSVHFGGKSVGDGPSTGLGILGWDSEDEARAAFTKPEAQAALQKYQTFGKSVGVMVKLDI
ncbi:hypothetical protein ColLi_10023 [Colletotrichum liriopes]|uniref:ABM domain-containing protein n=1 Tax=Colletotrichum liriopes TaxID=708192 RepID=A0AA37GTY5_9PEZI|nr:hypothetical protein ColLi_10023 [Colletotrichum liriopes]